jgi:chromosome segregation ATPase
MIVTEQEMIDSLKEELKKVLDIKNFCQKEMEKLEAQNKYFIKEINRHERLIESIYSVLTLAGCSPPED